MRRGRCTRFFAVVAAAWAMGGAPGVWAIDVPQTPAASRADSLATAPAPAAPATAEPAPGTALRPKKVAAYNDLWRFGGEQRVHEDEVVRGQMVVVGGNLRVDGEITGGAVVIGGNIDVGARGRVGGQTVAVAGRVVSAPGADVQGALSLRTFSTPLFQRWGTRAPQTGEIVSDLLKTALLLLLSWVLLRLFRPHLENARREFAAGGLRCVGLGLFALPAAVFTAIVVAFLLALSLVGLPIALLLLAAVGGVSLVALLAGAFWLGSWLGSRRRPARAPTWRHLALGLLCMRIPELVADVLRWASPESRLAFGFEIADVALELAVLAGGLGALVLVRWGAGARPAGSAWLAGA